MCAVRKYFSGTKGNLETIPRSFEINMRFNWIELSTFLFSLSCVSFVFYQGYNCWIKYKEFPETTQVSIKKSTRYPDITFCPSFDFYRKRMDDCNISVNSYFNQNQWNDTVNCSDPIKLHKNIVGNVTDFVRSIIISGDDIDPNNIMNVDLDYPKSFRVLDFLDGRCYSLQWDDITFDTVSVKLIFLGLTYVYIHAPGNFYETKESTLELELMPQTESIVNVLYETFKVLSYDGDFCQNDEAYNRDDCLYSAIQEVLKTKYDKLFFLQ